MCASFGMVLFSCCSESDVDGGSAVKDREVPGNERIPGL